MKKQEKIKDLKDEIKNLTNELKETKELLKIVMNNALKWKNKYKEIKKHYVNLTNEKQVFINTQPQKIVNVEIKGDLIFKPNNSFYNNSDFLFDSNIFENNEMQLQKNKTDEYEKKEDVVFKKPELAKKEISLCKKYDEIDEDESSSLLQELDVSSDNISLQGNSNNLSSLANLYESNETMIRKKRRRRKKY